MSFTTTFHGLEIEYTVEDYSAAVPYLSNGDPGYPAEGGYCEDWEIVGIDDMDELFQAIEAQLFDEDPSERWLTKRAFRLLEWCVQDNRWEAMPAKQQEMMMRRFVRFAERHWACQIEQHCTEHYWDCLLYTSPSPRD